MNATIIKKALVNSGAIVTLVSTTGGWTTYLDSEGKEKKIRNSGIRDLTEMEQGMFGGKEAKAPTKKADKKEAAPAPKAKKGRDPVSARPETDDVLSPDGSEFVSKDKLVKPDYGRYVKHDTKSPSGRKALDIGDEAAAILRGQAIEDCYFIVAKNLAKANNGSTDEADVAKIEAELKDKYKHLNVGMQRMNLGNRLRKAMGTYGNLNAHTKQRKTDVEPGPNEYVPTEAELAEDEANGGVKYGKRAGEILKRATDPRSV